MPILPLQFLKPNWPTVTSQAVNFVDVGIKLYVTSTINRDGFVTMKIRPEISSATAQALNPKIRLLRYPLFQHPRQKQRL